MDGQLSLADLLAIVRRRILFLVVPALAIGLGAVLLAFVLPPTYEASATILVESQQIRPDLASTTVTAKTDERLQVIQQRLLARDNLLQIAGKFDLYAYAGANRSPTSIVDELRQSITIAQIGPSGAARPGVGVIGFTVKFEYRDATVASRVTNELVASILAQNIETRLSSASETSTFFTQQQEIVERQLLDLETKIADFKRANESDLPETLPARRIQLTLLGERLAALEQQIKLADTASGSTVVATAGSDAQQFTFTLQARELELEALQDERDRIAPLVEKGYTAKNKLDDLEQRIAIAELNVESVKAQIAAAGGLTTSGADQTEVLEQQRDDLNQQIASLSDSISRTPVVEVELNAMTRDYDSLQTEYVQVKAKVQEASTGERLEQDRQAERFEVLEQATVPEQPKEPNRPRIAILGAVGGIAAGIALVILLELLNKTIYSARDLERIVGLRPIATIPYITTSSEVWLGRGRRAAVYFGLAAIAVVIAVAIHFYIMPLDSLLDRSWRFVQRRLGIVA